MRTAALYQFLAIFLTGNLLYAQISSTAEKAKERYQQRVSAAEKIKDDGIAKLTQTYEAEVQSAQAEAKKLFEALIRTAAMRNQTEEVRTLTFQMESILNPDGSAFYDENSGQSTTGSDFRQLLGKWETVDSSDGYLYGFEFKSPRTLLYTYKYQSSGGGDYSRTEEWKGTTRSGKFVFEPKSGSRYPRSYKQWFEITIPFETDSLEITQFTESEGSNSSKSYRLRRKQ